MSPNRNRLDARKRKTHEQIIEAAGRLIENDGLGSLSLDKIAEVADISRATLFNHMHTRDELLVEVLSPVFDDCIAMLEGLRSAGGASSMGSIEEACIYMWKNHKGTICRSDCAPAISGIAALKKKHDRLVRLFIMLFEALPESVELRLPRPKDAALLVFRTFIPILDSLAGEKDFVEIFRQCVYGLAVKRPA